MNADADLVPGVLVLALFALVLAFWIRALLRITMTWAILALLPVSAFVAIWLVRSIEDNSRMYPRTDDSEKLLTCLCALVMMNLGVALILKVYRAAVLEQTTPQERMPGMPGVRAWLGPLNVLTVVAVAATAPEAFGWNYFGVFMAGICLLLVYPLIASFQQSPILDAPGPQAAPEERQRVLALVESGKITAEDGAELLTALAQSQAAGRESAASISRPRRLMILGAIVLLVGFFLPWFTENITEQMSAMMNNLQQTMPQFAQVPPGMQQPVPVPTNVVNQIILRGGDVRNGLGWIALGTGILAAILPFFWSERSGDQKPIRNVTFVALGVGSIALLYLLSNSFNAVTTIEPGFIVAMAGYVLLWIGGVRDYGVIRPRVGATLATA